MNFTNKKSILKVMLNYNRKRSHSSDQFFIETQMGIVTRMGEWFHITSDQIEKFAPGLLNKIPLKDLIREAQAWVSSTDSLSLMLLYLLLFFINPWIAAGITVVYHWFWYHYKSAFVIYGGGSLLRIINSDAFMFIIAFICLSLLGLVEHYVAAGIGIVFFLVLKPGFLKKGWDKLDKTQAGELTLNDRVLKMIIIKQSMHYNIKQPEVGKMEEQIQELATNRKEGKE